MWGGIYAVLFSVATITSPQNPIRNGFPETYTQSFEKITLSKVEFQNKIVGNEFQYTNFINKKLGPIQPGYSISVTDQGGLWFGAGFIKKIGINDKFNFNLNFLPGIYLQNNEEDLGGWIMFRSGVELEYKPNSRWAISVSYDHRSSGDIWRYNPGMETISLSFSRVVM